MIYCRECKILIFKVLFMAFFNSAVDVFQTLMVALGADMGVCGVINLQNRRPKDCQLYTFP